MPSYTLITGVNGFSGFYLTNYILAKGENVNIIGLDLQPGLNLQKKWLDTRRICYIKNNLADIKSLIKILNKYKPQKIYHLAGIFKTEKVEEYLKSNILPSLHILDAIITIPEYKPDILFIGSAAEYGISTNKALSELDPLRPISNYGWTKKIQTEIGLSYSQKNNLNINIARTFNLVGPGLSDKLLIGNLIRQVQQGKKSVEVNNLQTERDFLDVKDAVDAYYKINHSNLKGQVFNICSHQKTSLGKIITLLKNELLAQNIQITLKENKKNIPATKISYGSNTKAKKMLGWGPQIKLKDSIKFIFQEEMNVKKN